MNLEILFFTYEITKRDIVHEAIQTERFESTY